MPLNLNFSEGFVEASEPECHTSGEVASGNDWLEYTYGMASFVFKRNVRCMYIFFINE